MRAYPRGNGLTRWYRGFSGPGGPICNDPLSIDIGLQQLEIGRCQFASVRCELTSARCELASPRRQLTSSCGEVQPLGAIDIASMSVAIASMRIDIAPSSIDIALMSIPFTRCEFTSPRCQSTSARCNRPLQRLPARLRPAALAPARGRPSHGGGNRQMSSFLFTLTRRFGVSQFPRTEAEIAALALVVIEGLRAGGTHGTGRSVRRDCGGPRGVRQGADRTAEYQLGP